MRIIVTASALCMTVVGLSMADEVHASMKQSTNIPAQPLAPALQSLAKGRDFQIVYVSEDIGDRHTAGAVGEYTPEEALKKLLNGTGLTYKYLDDRTVTIVPLSDTTARQARMESAASDPKADDPTGASKDTSSSFRLAQEAHKDSTEPSPVDTANDQQASQKKPGELEEVVVTGTHIQGQKTASPVIEIGREEIARSGYTSLSDVILSVPQNFGGGINPGGVANNSQVNSSYADNPTGASVPNLRGLGPSSTLTLIDGHRMAAGLSGGGADISSIPLDAVERVDILTDSASAIYGSDAVAGVVNVILKKNYDGARTSLSYGMAPDGGGTQKRASQLFGTTWNSGHMMVAYEHAQQSEVDSADRKFTSTAYVPNSLLPRTLSNSVTLSGRQDILPNTSVFTDGIYIARNANSYINNPESFAAPVGYQSTLRRFEVAYGVEIKSWHGWNGALVINDAEDTTVEYSYLLTTPITEPELEPFKGSMHAIEANANGDVLNVPSGLIRMAFGVGIRKEGFSRADGTSSATLRSQANGSRNVGYGYGELAIPLVAKSTRTGLNSLDLIVSGRTEHYSDVGGTTVPKVGVVYVPDPSLKVRSTWGRAFRAPTLAQTDGIRQLAQLSLTDPQSSTGNAITLVRLGGNPELKPETANTFSVGADYSPTFLQDTQISATAFEVKYKNRISQIGYLYSALTDPFNAFFVTRSPSAGDVQSLVNEYPSREFFNQSGSPYSPSGVAAVVDAGLVNVARQRVRGVDLNFNYKITGGIGSTYIFLNGSYIDLTQQNTDQSPSQTLSGLAFYTPKWRARGGVTWKPQNWAFTATANYLAHEQNTQVTPSEYVASWTTFDGSVRYEPALHGLFKGLNLNLAVLNIANKSPPYLLTDIKGLNYDSSNTSALGRYVTLQVSKEW